MRAKMMDVRILWLAWQFASGRPMRDETRKDLDIRFLRMFKEIEKRTGEEMVVPGRPDDEVSLDNESNDIYCRMEEEWDKIMSPKS